MSKNDFHVEIDTKQLRRDIQRALGDGAKQALKSLTVSDLTWIGAVVIEEMKIAIAKGISPIKDNGRFPAYKWAAKKSEDRQKKKFLSKKKKYKKSALDQKYSSKYPYSAMGKFPGKRERPVNLELSGGFLDNLKSRIIGSKLFIGFFEDPWMKYEQGHREGDGQPKRPIIPSGSGEEFSQSIYRRLVKTLQYVFDSKK